MDLKLNELVSNWKNISKKKMFGGTGYLINGNMVAGIYKDNYILRLGEKKASEAVKLPKIKFFDITGRSMKGWVMAEKDAFPNEEKLEKWVTKAREFVNTLPAK
jgi:TfoX/Sxy family transcriptional regulator of competence genes